MKTLIFILASILMIACTEFDVLDGDHWEVCDEAKVHVDKFYEEAALRGIPLQHRNLMISLQHLDGIWGRCYSSDPPIISLSLDYVLERTRVGHTQEDSLLLQYLVFHELGHALLYRDHNHKFSMMSSPENHPAEYLVLETRIQLIDELFGKKTKTDN